MRVISSDHVLFNECIPMFRPETIGIQEDTRNVKGYLLFDFEMTETLLFEHFSIEPTIRVNLTETCSAFVAPVNLPKWSTLEFNPHLFCIGLAAVVSFVTRRPVKAPRDEIVSSWEVLDPSMTLDLALQFPILINGPGSHEINLSQKEKEKLIKDLKEMVEILFSIPYEIYCTSMQSIRLNHLSYLNKREDFGLAYYLLISSMEPIATKAISKELFSTEYPKELEQRWKALAKKDEDIKKLRLAYYDLRGKPGYIGKRFIEFIMTYCPPEEWIGLEHPKQSFNEIIEEATGVKNSWVTAKVQSEIYPDDLEETDIREILQNLYDHRSGFTHEGKNPPHKNPLSSNRFFERDHVFEERNGNWYSKDIVLPNFQLVSFIANRSIRNYLKKQY